MAGRTERHEVSFVMRSAFTRRLDVVDQRRRGYPPFLSAQSAEGMRIEVLLADLPPSRAIALPCLGTAIIAFIVSCNKFLMFLTIPSVGQSWTTRVGTRSLGFVGHERLSFGHEKSPGGFPELSIGPV